MADKKRVSVQTLCLCALFAALTAALSQVAVPNPLSPGVPVTFAHISIFTAAGLLGAKYATVSQVLFVLLGAIGLPVFTQFQGGLHRIVGPTGGYIVGNIGCVLIAALIIDRFGRSVKVLVLAMLAGYVSTYFFGIAWFMYITNTGLRAALIGILPFMPGEAVKIIASVILIKRLYPFVAKRRP